MRLRSFALCLFVAMISACSQSGSTLPNGQTGITQSGRLVKAQLIVKVPQGKHPRKHGRATDPRYISEATAKLRYQVKGHSAVTVALSTSNPACTEHSGYLLCKLLLAIPPGNDTITFTALDSKGTALSSDELTKVISVGKSNTVAVVLGGLMSSISVTPVASTYVTGTQTLGYSIFGTNALNFNVAPLDADGYTIIGPGAPSVVEGTPAPDELAIATPAPSSTSSAWTLQSSYAATDPGVADSTTLHVQATPVPNSGGKTVKASVGLSLYTPWLYSTFQNNTVVAYNEQSVQQTLSGSFDGLSGSTGITYDPDNGFLYICENGNDIVTAYDRMGNEQTLTGAFSGIEQPLSIVYDPHDQVLYVGDNRGVHAFDAEGNNVTLTAPSPFANVNGPQSIVFDPNNDWLYVTNYNSSSVTAYDEEGNQKLTSGSPFSGLDNPRGLALDTNNGDLYVTNTNGSTPVAVFDAAGTAVTVSGTWAPNGYTLTGSWLSYDPHADVLYFSPQAGARSIVTYDTQGNFVSAITLSQVSSSTVVVP